MLIGSRLAAAIPRRCSSGCFSRLPVVRKVTRGVDPPEVEGYGWDCWKLTMIAKLNTDGAFHSWKWSCVWSRDVGSGLDARSDWMIDEHEVPLGAKEGQVGYGMTDKEAAKAFADSLLEALKEAAEEAHKACK